MNKRLIISLHVAIWLILFLSPLTFMNHTEFNLVRYLMMCVSPLALMVVFYANYLWLTPCYFISGEKRYYWVINIVLIIVMGIAIHCWVSYAHSLFDDNRPYRHKPEEWEIGFFLLRDIFNLAIAAAVATAIHLAMRWQASENARRQAEAERAAAELKNLRSQINPHFLLNTLNNIYALTAFDSGRAQEAIQELSKMLRHVLYDNQQSYVNLSNEVQFLTNYINLMKIRLANNVDVQTSFEIPEPCNIRIAPLIFISLIENAFKHGVSPVHPSYIHVKIAADEEKIVCNIENSYYPKTENDRSGHGIGLAQVAQRLDLTYPGKYEWERGTNKDRTKYSSIITIYDTKLCYH